MTKMMRKWKNKFAEWLLKLALRIDDHVIFKALPAPSISIFARFEGGTEFWQSFGYSAGENDKCSAGLTKLLGRDVFAGLLTLMNEGIVKEGAKEANVSIVGNEVFVDGTKVWEKDEPKPC